MNVAEFHSQLSAIMARAANEGIARQQMDLAQLFGVIELCKLDMVRNFQDQARTNAPGIVAARRVPPNFPNGH